MSSRARLPSRSSPGPEAGFAVPTVTLMILAALSMAGVAVSTSIGGQGGVVRDQETKTALAVAESGVEQALLQFNRYGLVSESDPCAPLATGSPDPETGWCGPVTGTHVNGGEVTYWVRPTATEFASGEFAFTELEVVAEATVAGTARRVELVANSSAGQNIFLDAAVQSEDGITINSNAEIHAGTATNGDLTIDSNARQCGTATVGIGKELKGEGEYSTDIECAVGGGEPAEDEISLPPVRQGDVPESNDNHRLFGEDPISGNNAEACWDGLDGNGEVNPELECGPRELLIASNSSVTLGGSVYSFCKLTLRSNSSLYIAAGAEVKIYFDSPENCGYEEEPVTQFELRSNSRITSAEGDPVDVGLLFVGSTEIDTRIVLNSESAVDGPCEQNFAIYAPYTDIELDSETKFCGGLAGKTVHLKKNAEVWTSSGIDKFYLPLVAPHYVSERFVDCRATAASGAPDEGC